MANGSRPVDSIGSAMRRKVKDMLPGTGRARILRFSGRSSDRSKDGVDTFDLADEDALYRALGRIAANWSLIEIASGLVLMGLVGSRDETLARAVVAGQRVENVWATIEALLSASGDETADQLAAFQEWRRAANRYRRRRNEAIHSAWSLTTERGQAAAWDVMSQRAKRGTRSDLFPGGVSELDQLARDIALCEDELGRLHADILERQDQRSEPGDGGHAGGQPEVR